MTHERSELPQYTTILKDVESAIGKEFNLAIVAISLSAARFAHVDADMNSTMLFA